MDRITRSDSSIPLHTADGNGRPAGPAPEDPLWSRRITSLAWEGWWWDPAEESATDSEIRTTEG